MVSITIATWCLHFEPNKCHLEICARANVVSVLVGITTKKKQKQKPKQKIFRSSFCCYHGVGLEMLFRLHFVKHVRSPRDGHENRLLYTILYIIYRKVVSRSTFCVCFVYGLSLFTFFKCHTFSSIGMDLANSGWKWQDEPFSIFIRIVCGYSVCVCVLVFCVCIIQIGQWDQTSISISYGMACCDRLNRFFGFIQSSAMTKISQKLAHV